LRLIGWLSEADRAPLLLDAAGIAALSALIRFFHWFGEYQPFLYQRRFALVAITTVLLIAVVVHPRPRLLGHDVMRWIDTRSYSMYLWPSPIFTITRPQLDVSFQGIRLLALRLALTAILAEASYRWVETPFRAGAVGHAWRSFREAEGEQRRRLRVWWADAAGTSLSLMLVLGVAVVGAQAQVPPSYLSSISSVHATSVGGGEPGRLIPAAASPQPSASAQPQGESASPAPSQLPASATPADSPPPAEQVTAIGDSMIAGAAGALQQEIGNFTIDAEIGIQTANAIDHLRARKDAGQLGQVVVGPCRQQRRPHVLVVRRHDASAEGVKTVLFVNVKVPRPWEGPNNGVLAGGVSRYPNAKLLDWRELSVDHPEFFWDDGIHLRPYGQKFYDDMIAGQVRSAEAAR
jgi:hypothetical protein